MNDEALNDVQSIKIKDKHLSPRPSRNGLPDDVSVVWHYYVEQYGKKISQRGASRLLPTKKRISKIRARKKEGYTDDELKRAIDGVLDSDFHRERHFLDIELICRDQGHVEQYIAWGQNGNGSGHGRVLGRL